MALSMMGRGTARFPMASLCVRGLDLLRTQTRRSAPRAQERAFSSAHALALGYVRKLDDIVKLDLLEREMAPAVKQIWEDYHREAEQAWGLAIDVAQYEVLRARLVESPMFIIPVRRDKGFFTLAMQHKERSISFTFLEEYKRSPETAVPWLFATLYDDLVASKGLALLRADFLPHLLTREEAVEVLKRTLELYASDKYDRVWIFNHASKHFKIDEYLKESGCDLEPN
jgi:hypothetical protein